MRVPFRLLAGFVALGLVAGCSGSVSKDKLRSAEGNITGLTVSGAVGSAPVVRMAAPLRATGTETVVSGTGPVLVADQEFLLQLTLYDAGTGTKTRSTYDAGQSPKAVKSEDLAPELSKALLGQRQGSRVVLAQGGTVLIADIVAVPPAQTLDLATGTAATPSAGLPRVVTDAGVPSGLDFSSAGAKPTSLQVVPLIEGDGAPVRDDSLVTVRSISQVWGRGLPFDDSFAKEPVLVPIGIGTMVRAWDQALVGVRRGSRLLVIAPPDLAFGAGGRPPLVPPDATIGYVIDVLGVS